MKTDLQNIILASTSFTREKNLKLQDEFILETDIEIRHGITGKNYLVVEFTYIANFSVNKKNKKNQITYSSKHAAQFKLSEFDNTNEEDLILAERFANINAAAMIFPFIRENAATISAKAGMSPIMIPVTNFVDLYESKKRKIAEENK